MKTGAKVLIGGTILCAGAMVIMASWPKDKSISEPSVLLHKTTVMAEKNAEVSQNPQPKVPVVGEAVSTTAPSTSTLWKEFPHREELEGFHRLHNKVFLSDEDKSFKKNLLSDERVLRSLQDLLETPARTLEEERLQNTALDVLLESLKGDADGVAARVLRDVVAHPSVEEATLDIKSRKSLAGVKAEVLFQWSALYPNSSSELERLLPGPVSQKIWNNVKSRQQNNLAESTLEKMKK